MSDVAGTLRRGAGKYSVTIDSGDATYLLQCTNLPAPLDPDRVARAASVMKKSGNWTTVETATIVVRTTGFVTSGLETLSAIVSSGQSQAVTLVVHP